MTDSGVIGRNVQRTRIETGYSKRRFSKVLGVHEYQLRRWEDGKVQPSMRHLAHIADITGRSVDWFLMDHDDPPDDGTA